MQQRLETYKRWGMEHPFIVIYIAALSLILPLFAFITPTLDDNDLLFYKLILGEFSSQFWHGDCYPRWLYSVNDGLGSPVFLYYGPVSFYLASMLQWLAGIDADGTIRFILSIGIARTVAGATCYFWLRHHCSKAYALLATLLYLSIPYTIHIIYVQTAFANQWAMAFIFMIFLSLDRLLYRRRFAVASVAITTALLIMTHLPTAMTFLGVPFLYVYILSVKNERYGNCICLIAADILALGLCAIYLLPLYMNTKYINAAYFYAGRYNFSNNFLNNPNELYCVPYFIIAAIAFYYGIKLFSAHECSGVDEKKKLPVARPFFYFIMVQTLIISFLLLPISLPIWQIIKPLQYIQFPFRFLGVLLLPFALCAAFLIYKTRWAPWVYMVWGIGILLHAFMMYAYAPHNTDGMLNAMITDKLIIHSEYLTPWNKEPDFFKKLIQHQYKAMPQIALIAGQGTVEVQPSTYDTLVAQVKIRQAATLQFKRVYFPAIQIKNLINGTVLKPYASAPEGFVNIYLMPGDYRLEMSFGSFEGEYAGKIVSTISLALILLIMAASSKNYSRLSYLGATIITI